MTLDSLEYSFLRKKGTITMKNKTLIIYYSQARGNTKRIAEMIKDSLEADILRIDTAEPYTGSYQEIVDQGMDEVKSRFKPEIKEIYVDLSQYDRFIIGTPTWWYTMAPAMLTFLTSNDWTGKTVVPFQTDGGWPGHVLDDMKHVCKGAAFEHEMAVQFDSTGGDKMETSLKEVDEWISELK